MSVGRCFVTREVKVSLSDLNPTTRSAIISVSLSDRTVKLNLLDEDASLTDLATVILQTGDDPGYWPGGRPVPIPAVDGAVVRPAR